MLRLWSLMDRCCAAPVPRTPSSPRAGSESLDSIHSLSGKIYAATVEFRIQVAGSCRRNSGSVRILIVVSDNSVPSAVVSSGLRGPMRYAWFIRDFENLFEDDVFPVVGDDPALSCFTRFLDPFPIVIKPLLPSAGGLCCVRFRFDRTPRSKAEQTKGQAYIHADDVHTRTNNQAKRLIDAGAYDHAYTCMQRARMPVESSLHKWTYVASVGGGHSISVSQPEKLARIGREAW